MRRDTDRPGRRVCSSNYRPGEFRERGVRARRFAPCPHCGAAVAARERVWTPPYAGGTSMVFREARCVNGTCGWHYFKTGGSREAFVAETNRRTANENRD